MREGANMLEVLVDSIQEHETLRVSHAWSKPHLQANVGQDNVGAAPIGQDNVGAAPAIMYVKLRRREHNDCVVLSDLEKRNIVTAKLERVRAYLMRQSTVKFTACAVELGDVLDRLMDDWNRVQLGEDDDVGGGEHDVGQEECNDSESDVHYAMWDSEEDGEEEEEGSCEGIDELVHSHSQPQVLVQRDTSGDYSPPGLGLFESSSFTMKTIQDNALSKICKDNFFCTPSPPQVQRRIKSAVRTVLFEMDSDEEKNALNEVDNAYMYEPNVHTAATAAQTKPCGGVMAKTPERSLRSTPMRMARDPADVRWYAGPTTRAGSKTTDARTVEDATPTTPMKDAHCGKKKSPARSTKPRTPARTKEKVTKTSTSSTPSRTNDMVFKTEDGGKLETLKLPTPSVGNKRSTKQKGETPTRVAVVNNSSKCPVNIVDFTDAIRRCIGLERAYELVLQYPQLLTEPFLMTRKVTVTVEHVKPLRECLNFCIPVGLVKKVSRSLQDRRKEEGGHSKTVNLSTPPSAQRECVARLTASMTGLSE
jgi:hypothetical protein